MTSFSDETPTFDFIGARCIKQGADWVQVLEFRDEDGNPINMSVYQPANGGSTRMAIKSESLASTYFATATGTIGFTWLNQSQLQVRVPAAASAAVIGPLTNVCKYQIEATQGPSGLVDRIAQGRIEMDVELVTTAT